MKRFKFYKLLLAVTVIIIALLSCGTSKKATTKPIPQNKAFIYIKRPPLVGALWVHYMELNGIYLGQVKGGDCIKIEVDPGTYILNYYNGSMMTYETAKQLGASFTKTFALEAGDEKFVRIIIKPVEITCTDEDGSKGYNKINNTIDFAILEKMSRKQNDVLNAINTEQVKDELNETVEELNDTNLERIILRWDIQSRPQGADIFWRVVSKTPEVKSTNNKYLQTTPYEATKAVDIKGLTPETANNVRIILRCEKDGYLPQEKEYNVRMVLDQEEISAFFKLVKEDE